MSLALPTVVGRCVGAGDYAQTTYYIKKMLLIAQFGSMIINITVFLSLPAVLSLYDLSAEAAWYAGVLVAIHSGWTILLGTSSGPLPSALRAAGDARYTMTIAVLGLLIGRLFFSVVFSLWLGLGIIGMWLAMGTHWSFNSIGGYLRFRSGKWKTKKVI